MAAKGSKAKQEIFDKLLSTFEGSFMYNNGKELRIPWNEDGNEVQIKVALTCAKDNVMTETNAPSKPAPAPTENDFVELKHPEPTAEEKENIANLLNALGL